MGLETCWVLSQRPLHYHLNQLSTPAPPVDWAACWPQLFRHGSSVKDLSGLANHHLCHTEKLEQLALPNVQQEKALFIVIKWGA
jgi:hypothetical protein